MRDKIGSVYSIPGLKYRDPLKNHTIQTTEAILKEVGDHFELAPGWVATKSRIRSKVLARQIAMHFMKKMTRLSLKDIGQHFGGRDHTTVIHSIRLVRDLMDVDPALRQEILKIECKLI